MENIIINESSVETQINVATDFGFKAVHPENYKLILWNDDFNDMVYVMTALNKVCNLSPEESFMIMLEAHTNGKAVAKIGVLEEIKSMKDSLNQLNIEATIEQEK